jgi:hypothetical protein
MAEERAARALAELQAGRQVAAREPKLTYGGNGLPIREQVLARDGTIVITRNAYGAHCLNEPDVLFADIDVEPQLPSAVQRRLRIVGRLLAVLGLATAMPFFWLGRWPFGCGTLILWLLLTIALADVEARRRRDPKLLAETRDRARQRILDVATAVPGGRFDLYETPAGFRLLALHATFEPTAAATVQLLHHLDSDPGYVRMCELQNCFRARVSGKPWRMGVRHIRPRPGVWPVHPDRMASRLLWIEEYEAVARNHAACRFLATIGSGRVLPRCAEVQRVHDQLSRARSKLPLA